MYIYIYVLSFDTRATQTCPQAHRGARPSNRVEGAKGEGEIPGQPPRPGLGDIALALYAMHARVGGALGACRIYVLHSGMGGKEAINHQGKCAHAF